AGAGAGAHISGLSRIGDCRGGIPVYLASSPAKGLRPADHISLRSSLAALLVGIILGTTRPPALLPIIPF
ncbi:MAG: hypothetical protein ACTS6J_21975, partial [Burkholderiales bacterium]